MKTIKITASDRLEIVDVDFNDYKDIQAKLGGYVETVRTERLQEFLEAPVLMLCDEEGLIKKLPMNVTASFFYGTHRHGCPIAGDVLLAVEAGEFLFAPASTELNLWVEKLKRSFSLKEEVPQHADGDQR